MRRARCLMRGCRGRSLPLPLSFVARGIIRGFDEGFRVWIWENGLGDAMAITIEYVLTGRGWDLTPLALVGSVIQFL